MPVIRTETIPFDKKPFKKTFTVNVTGMFSCKLPEPVAEVMGFEAVNANTLDDCDRTFNKTLQDYYARNTSVRRLIVYKVLNNAYIWNSEGTKVICNDKQIGFCDGVAISVCANVFDEHKTETNGETTYFYKEVKDNGILPSLKAGEHFTRHTGDDPITASRDIQAIEFSPERLEFFNKVGKGLEAVILQMQALQGSNAQAVIDTGDFTAKAIADKVA
jgi:hypothetical protein